MTELEPGTSAERSIGEKSGLADTPIRGDDDVGEAGTARLIRLRGQDLEVPLIAFELPEPPALLSLRCSHKAAGADGASSRSTTMGALTARAPSGRLRAEHVE